jgi:fluoride exporter
LEAPTLAWKLIGLCLAGAAGTLARYGLAGVAQRIGGAAFPWGTFAVNMAGCFLVGLLWVLLVEKYMVSSAIRTVIFVGFMGAFTTFSAFALETGELLRSSGYLYAAANVVCQNVLGIALLFTGAALGRLA